MTDESSEELKDFIKNHAQYNEEAKVVLNMLSKLESELDILKVKLGFPN